MHSSLHEFCESDVPGEEAQCAVHRTKLHHQLRVWDVLWLWNKHKDTQHDFNSFIHMNSLTPWLQTQYRGQQFKTSNMWNLHSTLQNINNGHQLLKIDAVLKCWITFKLLIFSTCFKTCVKFGQKFLSFSLVSHVLFGHSGALQGTWLPDHALQHWLVSETHSFTHSGQWL